MNMKKTMAAIAAGAVAVSAMATTVSAINEGTYTYSLVQTVNSQSAPTKTFTFTVNAPAPAAATEGQAATYEWTTTTTGATTTAAAPTAADATLTYTSIEDPANAGTFIWVKDATTDTTATTELTATAPTAAAQTITFTANELTAAVEGTDAVEYPEWIKFGGWAVGTGNALEVEKMVVKINPSATGEQNKTYTYSPNKANEGWNGNFALDANNDYVLNFTEELANYTSALTISVTVEAIDNWWMDTATVNGNIEGAGITASADGVDATPVVYAGSGANKTLANTVYVPFETGLKNNTNILWYLENATNLKGEWQNSYNNVTAVINDAIANFDSVTFKFNTCSSPVKYALGFDKTDDGVIDTYDYGTRYNTYEDAMIAGANGQYDYDIIAVFDDSDGCDKTYTSFAQHLYTSYYDPEATTWTGFAWEGHNLFQGALIVNEGLTMSLAQTDYFQWNETSLSFDWDGIMDYSITENSYATYLHSMKLATSTRWYWDSMVVECVAGDEEDAASDAGVDGDGAELDDEDAGEEIDVDDTADEEPAPEVDEEPAPAPEVSNPTTGNASVALAVIPVALAAAAVVAKKRS